jgi:hypothetical protein
VGSRIVRVGLELFRGFRQTRGLEDYLEALRKAEAPKNLGGNESCLWIRRSLLVLNRGQLVVKLPGNPDGLRLPCGIPLRGPTEGGIPQGESAVRYYFLRVLRVLRG